MIVIDATYIWSGGGKVLLNQLISAHRDEDSDALYLLDSRLQLISMPIRFRINGDGESGRRAFYREFGPNISRLLCLGNVPPPIRLNGNTATYFHNILIVAPQIGAYSMRARFLFWLKKSYIRFRASHSDLFIVQTEETATLLAASLRFPKEKIKIWPFWEEGKYSDLRAVTRGQHSFGYVSLPNPHKCHELLLQAWELLRQEGLSPQLHLTIPKGDPLLLQVDYLIQKGCAIVNHGYCDPREIYSESSFQIFPSLNESFGLGLIEAAEAGCAILAPDKRYVYCVVEPSMTWPSDTSEAIATCVRRALVGPVPPTVIKARNELSSLMNFLERHPKTFVPPKQGECSRS